MHPLHFRSCNITAQIYQSDSSKLCCGAKTASAEFWLKGNLIPDSRHSFDDQRFHGRDITFCLKFDEERRAQITNAGGTGTLLIRKDLEPIYFSETNRTIAQQPLEAEVLLQELPYYSAIFAIERALLSQSSLHITAKLVGESLPQEEYVSGQGKNGEEVHLGSGVKLKDFDLSEDRVYVIGEATLLIR